MKIEPGKSQAKPEQSVGSEAALGRQSSGRAGESLPTAPSTPARALLLRLLLRSTSLPSHQINTSSVTGKREGRTVLSLGTARCWPGLEAEEPEESEPCPGLGLAGTGQALGELPGMGGGPALHPCSSLLPWCL